MATNLDAVLRKLDVSDAQFGKESGLARGQIWAYRRGRKIPKADTVVAILDALKKRGVEMDVKDLIARAPRSGERRRRTG